jgi:hypothetical protein
VRHLKSILIIAVITLVAGFVIWQLMWMKEIGNRFKTEQSPGGVDYKIEAKKKNNNGHKGERERARPVGEGSMSVNESRTHKNQEEKTGQEREQPPDSKAATAVKPSGEKTEPQSVKESGNWFEKDINLGKKSQEVRSGPGNTAIEISNEKTMSVTIRSRPGQTTQKYIPQNISPQPPPGVSTELCKLINLSKHRRWTIEGREETGKDGRSKS